jgi:hypothetical protein
MRARVNEAGENHDRVTKILDENLVGAAMDTFQGLESYLEIWRSERLEEHV